MVQKNSNIDKGVLIITGPTASGKSAAAVETALAVGGEIICADSMQIYKNMKIGTAYPSEKDMALVPHHLFGIILPTESFSVAQYIKKANDAIDDILQREKIPILCGGTGLYISSLIKGIDYLNIPSEQKLRSDLENEYETKGAQFLLDKLHSTDPKAAQRLHLNDKKRIIRALEINILTGKTMDKVSEESSNKSPRYSFNAYCLDHERNVLYERIENRVDRMIECGLLEEVLSLKNKYGRLSSTAYQAIGYKELFMYLNGKCDLDTAICNIKKGTRNYAKRQLTWFRKMPGLIWLRSMGTKDASEKIIKDVLSGNIQFME